MIKLLLFPVFAVLQTGDLPAGIYLLVVEDHLNKMRNQFKIIKQ